jgi:hypothetical protein
MFLRLLLSALCRRRIGRLGSARCAMDCINCHKHLPINEYTLPFMNIGIFRKNFNRGYYLEKLPR